MRRGLSFPLAIIFLLQLCLLVLGQDTSNGGNGLSLRIIPLAAAVGAARYAVEPENTNAGGSESEAPPQLTVFPDLALPEPAPPPGPPIRGIYATAYSTGSARKFGQLIDFIRQTEVNALVVDVKDDTGTISYPSEVPLAKTIDAGRKKFDPRKVLDILRRERIYPIARIVVFKDSYLAGKRPDLAVRSKTGGIWRDYRGKSWVDPHSREVWRYTIDVAKEAATLGFREIQFDYVRFTSDGKLSDCAYPFADGRTKSEVIRDFLCYARQELKPLGVEVSADVFGLTCSCKDDLGIGQKFEDVATAVDIISPMVYPSHYYPGSYGLADPDLVPYDTVLASLRAAAPRVKSLGVRIRPWLQDFSLRHKYGRAQLMAQIKAVYDAGLTEWIFWNPGNNYHLDKYNTE